EVAGDLADANEKGGLNLKYVDLVCVVKVVFVIENIGRADRHGVLVLVIERPAQIQEAGVGRVGIRSGGKASTACQVVPSAPQFVDVAVVREEDRVAGGVSQVAHVVIWRRRQAYVHMDDPVRVILEGAACERVSAK